MTIKEGWTDDKESTDRTLQAMEYNIRCKQAIIDRLLAENQRLEEELRIAEDKLFILKA